MKEKRMIKSVIYHVLVFICGLIMLYPLIWMVMSSFKPTNTIFQTAGSLIPETFTLENYINGWKGFAKVTFSTFLKNSLFISIVATIGTVLSSAVVAYGFARFQFKGKKLLFTLTMATIMIPPDVLIVSNFTTISRMGLINTYAGMCSIFLVSATNVFLLRQFYLSFVKSLKEAAYVDGCGNVRFFLWVLLPASKPIMVTVFLSSFVSVWNQYVWPMLVTNRNEMRTIQVGITMLKDRESAIFGPVMAGVIVALLPTVLLFLIFQRKIVSGMMSGSVKE